MLKSDLMKINNKWVKNALIHLGLVLLASILFAASFPNLIIKNGIPFLAWFALFPVLIVINKNKLLVCALWGAIYGFFSYLLFNYWLGTFHPMAGIVTYSVYSFFLAVVFVLFKLALILFPKHGYLVQWVIWLAFEYLRTLGFIGYPYGIIGYSQWQMIPIIQMASITGVWGVSALVTFPSFWLASAFKKEEKENLPRTNTNLHEQERDRDNEFVWFVVKIKENINEKKVSAIAWVVVLVATLVFGFINMKDFSNYPKAQIALIQHNTDPWEADRAATPREVTEGYRRDLKKLIRLSDEALASEPKPQMIVWSETAFIPRIYWHATYRDDQSSWSIVRELLEYLSDKDVPFVIGNDDARRDPAINPSMTEMFRVDYNAALLFENGVNTATYRKMHLVPFTEHFPYKKQFPKIYEALEKADTHFWEKGTDETIFSGPGFTFFTPICFEDTFGYISRNFVRKGADVIVNLSNDAWSNSLPAQIQHLSMAVFRTVENNRPMVRSTSSGQTCAIDPNGRVIAEAPPFKEAYLNVSIPLIDRSKSTIYMRYGDYLGKGFSILAAALLLFGTLWGTIRKTKSRGQ